MRRFPDFDAVWTWANTVRRWTISREQLHFVTKSGRDEQEGVFAVSVLRHVHPDLPRALTAYRATLQVRSSLLEANGSSLRYQLFHLHNTRTLVDDELGLLWVYRVFSVHDRVEDNTVVFDTTAYTTSPAQPATATHLPVLCDTYSTDIQVSYVWLDENYPGWHERLSVAEALGYSDEATANYLLQPVSAAPVAVLPTTGLDTVSF